MHSLLAVILAGGTGERLSILSQARAKPAVPFAGKYRIIDFTISNCVNSGIHNILVLTQYQPVSLTEHIGVGTPWGLVPPDRSIRLLQPYLGTAMTRDPDDPDDPNKSAGFDPAVLWCPSDPNAQRRYDSTSYGYHGRPSSQNHL